MPDALEPDLKEVVRGPMEMLGTDLCKNSHLSHLLSCLFSMGPHALGSESYKVAQRSSACPVLCEWPAELA